MMLYCDRSTKALNKKIKELEELLEQETLKKEELIKERDMVVARERDTRSDFEQKFRMLLEKVEKVDAECEAYKKGVDESSAALKAEWLKNKKLNMDLNREKIEILEERDAALLREKEARVALELKIKELEATTLQKRQIEWDYEELNRKHDHHIIELREICVKVERAKEEETEDLKRELEKRKTETRMAVERHMAIAKRSAEENEALRRQLAATNEANRQLQEQLGSLRKRRSPTPASPPPPKRRKLSPVNERCCDHCKGETLELWSLHGTLGRDGRAPRSCPHRLCEACHQEMRRGTSGTRLYGRCPCCKSVCICGIPHRGMIVWE